jgi:hypothetical protein
MPDRFVSAMGKKMIRQYVQGLAEVNVQHKSCGRKGGKLCLNGINFQGDHRRLWMTSWRKFD